jgi:hypothetical protein
VVTSSLEYLVDFSIFETVTTLSLEKKMCFATEVEAERETQRQGGRLGEWRMGKSTQSNERRGRPKTLAQGGTMPHIHSPLIKTRIDTSVSLS